MSKGIKRDDIDDGAIKPGHLGTELHKYSLTFQVGDIAADSDAIKIPLWVPPANITLKKCMMGVDTDVAAADTNYNKIDLTDGTNVIATTSNGPVSGGNSFTAGTLEEIALVADYVAVTSAEQLWLEFTKTGNGLAMSRMTVQIDYTIDDPA